MDPVSLAASITALLQLTSSVIQYLNGVRGASEDRGRILSELASVNSILFILQDQADQAKHGDQWSSTIQSLNVSKGPLDQLRSALEVLASKLEPPATSIKKLGKAIVWPFQKEEVREILGSIERQKALLTLARQNDHIKLSKAIKDDIVLMRDEVEEVRRGVDGIQMSQMTSERLKIIEWLDAPDPWTNYKKALKDRNPKTGSWLIESSAYSDWKSTRGSFLWLHGKPGCGKTILSSTILQNVLDQYYTKPNSAVLFFYFDFNDAAKQQHERMIRSLICQLSDHSGITVLNDLYSSCFNGSRQPTGDGLLSTLRQMMASTGDTYIILDALDECTEREELLSDLEEMIDWEDTNSHVLATSRREIDIEEALKPLGDPRSRIDIRSTLVRADICTYVHDRLQVDRRLKRWQKDIKIQLEIEDTLLGKADGMFRWVACQLDILGKCFTVLQIRQSLASLPKTLDDTYARILCNIDEQFNHCNREVLKILQWLTFSARPLRLEEVAEILAIDVHQTPRFDPERRWPEPRDIIRICSSLITVTTHFPNSLIPDDFNDDSESPDTYSVAESPDTQGSISYVRLAHFSVKEYLISDRIHRGMAPHYSIREIESHGILAEDCIAYLLQPGSLTPGRLASPPLADYAAEFWATHAKHAGRGPIKSTTLLSMELLLSDGEGFLSWLLIANPYYGAPPASPLYYASRAGLFEQVKMLIKGGMDVNAQGGYYGNALQAASGSGHAEVAQILLDNGADVNAEGGYYCNALHAASTLGHAEVAQILLDNGADVNAQGGNYGNALQAASCSRHAEVAQILLDNGADVNAQGGSYGNALQAASCSGNAEVAQILLDNGADVNAEVGFYGNALLAASNSGHAEVARVLLDNGADVNAELDFNYGTALLAASHSGHAEVAQILLDNGADFNAEDGYSGNALQAASRSGHAEVAQILLDNGADVNAEVGFYGNALLAALDQERAEVVQFLLDNGADVNVPVTALDSALIHACQMSNEKLVKIFLDKGADANALSGYYRQSAVQIASERGSRSIVEMLVAKGAAMTGEGMKFLICKGEPDPLATSDGPDPEAIAVPLAHGTISPTLK